MNGSCDNSSSSRSRELSLLLTGEHSDKKMRATTIVYWGIYWGIYWGYIGIMEKKMETTIVYWAFVGTACCPGSKDSKHSPPSRKITTKAGFRVHRV